MMPTAITDREELAENFMYVDCGHLEENDDFQKMVVKVLKSDHKSVVTDEDRKAFELTYDTYKFFNDATLTFMLVPIMMKPNITAQDVDDAGKPCGEFQPCDFYQQGVLYSVKEQFKGYCLPYRLITVPDVPNTLVQEYYDTAKALTPKPDFAYGLIEHVLPGAPSDIIVSPELEALLKTTPVREIFFIWESRSSGRTSDRLTYESQALRDTAAVIYLKRKLFAYIGRASEKGIDTETFIYAATNEQALLHLWVAYAWLPEDLSRVEFCMDMISSTLLPSGGGFDNDPNTLVNIRKRLHNIIEWGSLERMPDLVRFYTKLWDVERGVSNRTMVMKAEVEAEADAAASKKKQKKFA